MSRTCSRSIAVVAIGLIVTILFTIWYALVSTPVANAGIYKLYSCNVPGRETPVPSTAPWTAKLDNLNTYFFDNCASGGSFGIGLNLRFMHPITSASLALVRPATGPKAAIGIVRYRTWVTAELTGSGAPAFIDDGGAFSPPGGTTPDGEPWVSVPFSQTNPGVYVRLQCSGGAPSDCMFDSTKPLQVRGVESDLYEDVPPTGEIEGGTLIDGGATSRPRTLSFTATDEESGVARVDLLLGDTVVGVKDLDSSKAVCPHTDLNACPSRYAADFVVDSSLIAPGEYPAILRITDAAGNRKLITSTRPALIGNGTASFAGKTKLTVSFPKAGSTYTTNFGRSVRMHGRLMSFGGIPLARARISVMERPTTRHGRIRTSFAVTAADGKFRYLASGRRPSRTIEFRYSTEGGNPALGVSRRLQLRVRAASTFKVSLSGILVHYSGRVLTHPLPRNGKLVFVQGRAAGGAWQRFAVRRTDKAGRFSGRYRLRVRRPGIKLQFRVEIPKQSGYPFAARVGQAVTRVVR
jgi:hypothetical protein